MKLRSEHMIFQFLRMTSVNFTFIEVAFDMMMILKEPETKEKE